MLGFSDETYIEISSGNGGSGCVSFRREKYVPKGGPDGGDGGKGGDVIFVVRQNARTLQQLKNQRVFRAQNGHPGMGARRHGKDGEDIYIPVPPGTIIKDTATGEVIKDLTGVEQWVMLIGGRGGKGNWHFRTARRKTPRFAQPGESGMEMRLHVELRIIADIGFVGFPNAGKSSLLNYLTNAHSKVAEYPFTTKIPHLGVFRYDDRDIILADIPGIIEGASHGAGMGIAFLKHISRTEALAFIIDVGDDRYLTAVDTLASELEAFSPSLAGRKRVIVVTKMDIPESNERLTRFKEVFPDDDIVSVSVFTGEGISELRQSFRRLLTDLPPVSDPYHLDSDPAMEDAGAEEG